MKQTKQKTNQGTLCAQKQRGITLISLVVCVVLLAILAAVLINISYEDVNLINTALGARETYTIETYKGVIEEAVTKKVIEDATMRRRSYTKRNRGRIIKYR